MEISRIISDLETLIITTKNYPNAQQPISEKTLADLQTLLTESFSEDDDVITSLLEELSSRKLSMSNLVLPITAAMDLHGSISAVNVYLSLLLSPNAPVFTLFTPMSFLSLLRSIRRSLKNPGEKSRSIEVSVSRKRKGKSSRNESVAESRFDVKELFGVLERLELVLGLIHLDRFPDSLKSLVQTVCEIPALGSDLCGNSSVYTRFTGFCSRILSEVMKAEHGDQAVTAAEVLKSLSLLILSHKSQARTFALGFVKERMIHVECGDIIKAVVKFPRYLSLKAPEKAEPRALAVDSIIEIVKVLEFDDQVGFVEYVTKMTQGKTQHRLLAVDLILILMTSLEDPLGVNLDNSEADNSWWGLSCLEALIQRCSDTGATIRARAISNLAQIVGFFSGGSKNRDLLKKVLGIGNGGMNDVLRRRCVDEKAAVRKAALLLISKLTSVLGGAFDGDVLKTLGLACSDPLVSIRKAAVSALSEAFRAFSDDCVTTEWLHSVPRLITDNESSIQEECENLFLELVLGRISRAGSTSSSNNETLFNSNLKGKSLQMDIELLLPEGALGLLKETCNGEVAPWVKKICTSLGKKKRLKPEIAVALQNIIRTSESIWTRHSMPLEKWTAPPGAWFLLSEVSVFLPKAVDWEFLHHHWQLLDKMVGDDTHQPMQEDVHEEEEGIENSSVTWAGDRVFLLQTISSVSAELPPEPAADLAHNLLKRVEEFKMHLTEVNAHVKALRTLCKRKALNSNEADTLVMRWVLQVLSKASQIIEMYISQDTETNKSNNFLTPPPKSASSKGEGTVSISKTITAIYTIGSLVIVCPSADFKHVIPVLHSIITSGNHDSKHSKLPGPSISVKHTALPLYIQAWVTMGKICLADGNLAKSYIPLFMQELENSDCAALRNNLAVMMADFCVRHTALVDGYISKVTKCLRDPCELVRRQTFILLSRLLQRDYVKWRGVLFLRFLLSLVDDSDKIKQLADFLFGNILKAKAPLLAYNSFVEAIFVLNDCHVHNGHADSKSSRTESRLFSVRGNDENARSKRMHIYVSLLKQMAPEHLLATFAKVCAEILAATSDGMLNIEDITGHSVLQDAFQILACKEIRISPNRGPSSDATDMEDEGGDISTSKGRAITQAVKKGLIQNTIPIFIELKRLLEIKNSPLIGSLMETLRVLLKDYKNEIEEILIADKQLQKELVYDMKKYETDKAKSTVAATMQTSNSYRSPVISKTVNRGTSVKRIKFNTKVASAMADAKAASKAKRVLKDLDQNVTTPLSRMSVPKLKSTDRGTDRHMTVLESLRRKQCFFDDES